jgi:hypothetical protein
MTLLPVRPADTHAEHAAPSRLRRSTAVVALIATLAVSAGVGTAHAAEPLGSAGDPSWYSSPTGSFDAERSAALAYEFLDERVDTYGSGDEMRLARSYQGGYFDTLPGGFVSSFVYDDALIVMSYLGRGLPSDVQRARAIGSALLHVQENDPFDDGRTRSSYQPDSLQAGVVEIGSASSFTGNQAWVGMALARLYEATGEQRFLDGAIRAGEWIETNTRDTERAPFGYTGGQDADGNDFTFKATEHNIDVTAFFAQLAELTGDAVWSEGSELASDFVASMQAEDGHLWTGTNTDGTSTNYHPIPEDPQAWSYLATLDERYAPSLTWTVDNLNATDGPYEGPSFSNADVSKVWFEGTGQLSLALRARNAPGDAAYVDTILSSVELAQREAPNADGKGIVAASSDGLDTGFGDLYYASLHTGATSWYLLALTGFNPFRLDEPSAPAPTSLSVGGGDAQSQTARQPFGAPLQVVARDADGAPVADQRVTFTVTGGSATIEESSAVAASTVVTGTDGVASARISAGRIAGPVTITATLPDAPSVPAATLTATVLSTAKARADLTVSVTGLPARLAPDASATVTVTVRNAGPNAASDVVTSIAAGPGITAAAATSRLEGATATWSSPGLASGASLTYTVSLTAGKKAALAVVTASAVSAVPDPRWGGNLVFSTVRVR